MQAYCLRRRFTSKFYLPNQMGKGPLYDPKPHRSIIHLEFWMESLVFHRSKMSETMKDHEE